MSPHSSHADPFLESFWQTLEYVPLVSLDQLLHSSFGQAVPAASQRERRKLLRSILHHANATAETVDSFIPIAVDKNGQPLLDSRHMPLDELEQAVQPNSKTANLLENRRVRFDRLQRQSTRRTAVYYSGTKLAGIPNFTYEAQFVFMKDVNGRYAILSTLLGLANYFLHHIPTDAVSTWQIKGIEAYDPVPATHRQSGAGPYTPPRYPIGEYSSFSTLAKPSRLHQVHTNSNITALDLGKIVVDSYVNPTKRNQNTTTFEIW